MALAGPWAFPFSYSIIIIHLRAGPSPFGGHKYGRQRSLLLEAPVRLKSRILHQCLHFRNLKPISHVPPHERRPVHNPRVQKQG